jgi:hypothetical protein
MPARARELETEWARMDSAPRSGVPILLLIYDYSAARPFVGRFDADEGAWLVNVPQQSSRIMVAPIAWAPIPSFAAGMGL